MAEKEYIEREALISDIKELPEQERIEYMGIYDCIKSHPTADVQEVVRCKDCSYFCKATVNKKASLSALQAEWILQTTIFAVTAQKWIRSEKNERFKRFCRRTKRSFIFS